MPHQALRTARRRADLTQAELASRAGLSERTVRKLESGLGSVLAMSRALQALGQEMCGVVSDRRHLSRVRRCQRISVTRRDDLGTWYTPPDLLVRLYEVFAFDLDPCSPARPTVKCRAFFTEQHDGLKQPWHGTVYMNPPYDDVPRWVEKALGELEARRARKVVALVPYRPEVSLSSRLVRSGADIFILEDRLRFGGRKHVAPSVSALVCWGITRREARALSRVLPDHHRIVASR